MSQVVVTEDQLAKMRISIPLDPAQKKRMQEKKAAEEALAAAAATVAADPEASPEAVAAAEAIQEEVAAQGGEVAAVAAGEAKDVLQECLAEILENVQYIGGKERPAVTGEQMTLNQQVFTVDMLGVSEEKGKMVSTAELTKRVVDFNGGRLWLDAISAADSVNNYQFPWPGKLHTYPGQVEKSEIFYSGAEVRLSETLAENQNATTKNGFTGLAMHMPFKGLKRSLPKMDQAVNTDAYHLIPVFSELADFSTEGLPFVSSAALATYGVNKKNQTMMVIHDGTERKIVTPGGVIKGLPLPPDTQRAFEFGANARRRRPQQQPKTCCSRATTICCSTRGCRGWPLRTSTRCAMRC